MKIDRYDTLITIIDSKTKIMLALKFIIEDGKLYAYNFYLPVENRKMVEVSEINGISISTIINQIIADDLYSVDKLKNFGIDTTTQFMCTVIDDNKERRIDIFSPEADINIFYKKHETNNIIPPSQEDSTPTTGISNNIMLDYASSNVKALLNILNNLSIENGDKALISEVLSHIGTLSENYSNVDNNLDMIFLSSQLLKLDDKLNLVPEYIERSLRRILRYLSYYDSESLKQTNNSILSNNEIDYKKVIKMIRNCIAHSNYKVLENGNIEFYNEGKNKLNIILNKKDIIFLFNQLYDYYYLEGAFPILLSGKDNYYNNSMNKETLEEYLRKLEIFDIGDYSLREYNDSDIQRRLDNDFGLDISYITTLSNNNIYNSAVPRDMIIRAFNSRIKKHLIISKDPKFENLTDKDVKYIINNIQELNEQYFYSLSKTTQIQIINNLIYQRYNKTYYFQKNMYEMLKTGHFDNDDLQNNASDYIKYKSKIELVITSLLNNLLLFCYNQNKSNIDVKNLRFPLKFYKEYLDSKVGNFYEISRDESDYRLIYTSLLKASSTHTLKEEDYRDVEKQINRCENRLIKTQNQVSGVSNIIDGIGTDEEFAITNVDLLNRMRDCLAHGFLTVNIKSIDDIMSTELHFYDRYDGKIQFDATISLGDLLKTINQPKFINSILNDNQNFSKHVR